VVKDYILINFTLGTDINNV